MNTENWADHAKLSSRITAQRHAIGLLEEAVQRQGNRIEQLEARIEMLENARSEAHAQIYSRIEALEQRVWSLDGDTSVDHMAEFRRQAATDDTPDPLDTRIAERPL